MLGETTWIRETAKWTQHHQQQQHWEKFNFFFLSTTLLTGMTGIFLHMQWPLTSQSRGSFRKESNFFLVRIKLHAQLSIFLETGGHPIVIEELTDAQLARVVEDMRRSVKRLSLETKMFEGETRSVFVHCKNAKFTVIAKLRPPTQYRVKGFQH
jgi:hypothetical protein